MGIKNFEYYYIVDFSGSRDLLESVTGKILHTNNSSVQIGDYYSFPDVAFEHKNYKTLKNLITDNFTEIL